MIPDSIELKHIRAAIQEIDKNGVPRHRKSTRYDLLHAGKRYPPKYVISLAHAGVDGQEWPSGEFGGRYPANNFLLARGFHVVDKRGRPVSIEPAEEDDKKAFYEGGAKFAKHRRIERNAKLARLVKATRLRASSDLACDACGFSFLERYGPNGAGFIEAHHTRPLSEMKRRSRVKPSDIALVCSNCHRMLHRARLSIAQLRKVIERHKADRRLS